MIIGTVKIQTVEYRGYIITIFRVLSRIGEFYRAENNYGQPKTETHYFRAIDTAVKIEKFEIDALLEDE